MDKPKLNVKQVLLTAAVTCAFAIIAGVSTYRLTNKSTALTYTVASGPLLSDGQVHTQIYSILIENTGRKEVESPTLHVEISKGSITKAIAAPPHGVTATVSKTNDTYFVSLASLNPHEKLGASLMLSLADPAVPPRITVRGRGVNGQESGTKKPQGNEVLFLIAGVVASVMALIVSVTPIMRKLTGRVARPSIFVNQEGSIGPFDRNELVAFICGLCGLNAHARQLRFAPSEISFRGAADYLISEAFSAESADAKQRFQLALQAMLLVEGIWGDSIDVIKNAVTRLGALSDAQFSELRKHAVHQDREPARLRAVLIDYILSKGTNLPKEVRNMPDRESKTTRTHEFDIVAGKNSYHTEIREDGHKIAEGDARTQEEAQQRASERANEQDEEEDE